MQEGISELKTESFGLKMGDVGWKGLKMGLWD